MLKTSEMAGPGFHYTVNGRKSAIVMSNPLSIIMVVIIALYSGFKPNVMWPTDAKDNRY